MSRRCACVFCPDNSGVDPTSLDARITLSGMAAGLGPVKWSDLNGTYDVAFSVHNDTSTSCNWYYEGSVGTVNNRSALSACDGTYTTTSAATLSANVFYDKTNCSSTLEIQAALGSKSVKWTSTDCGATWTADAGNKDCALAAVGGTVTLAFV